MENETVYYIEVCGRSYLVRDIYDPELKCMVTVGGTQLEKLYQRAIEGDTSLTDDERKNILATDERIVYYTDDEDLRNLSDNQLFEMYAK